MKMANAVVLHLGGDVMIPTREVVTILDVETQAKSHLLDRVIKAASREGRVIHVGEESVKSLILTWRDKQSIWFFSPISAVTLLHRSQPRSVKKARKG